MSSLQNYVVPGASRQKSGYVHQSAGYIEAENSSSLTELENLTQTITVEGGTTTIENDTITINGDTINLAGDIVNIGGAEFINAGGAANGDLHMGRYIYLNRNNPYDGSATDSGVVMNITDSASSMQTSSGFVAKNGSNKAYVMVSSSSGLVAGEFIQIRGSISNNGVYEVFSHSSSKLEIRDNPAASYSYSSFVNEAHSTNTRIAPVKVSIMRGSNDEDSIEFGIGTNGDSIEHNKAVYDHKSTAILGNVQLEDDADQIQASHVSISIDTPSFPDIIDRTITVPLLPFDDAEDTFVLENFAQTLKEKTLTDKSNNVIARGLWHASGAGNVSTYSSVAPSNGQMLRATSSSAASWTAPFTVAAGSGLTGGTAGGTNNTSITIKLNRDLDDPDNDPESPTADAPGTQGQNINLSVPINIAFAITGALAVAGVAVGAAGAFAFAGGANTGIGFDKDGFYTDYIEDLADGTGHIVINTHEADFLHDVRVRDNLYAKRILPLNSGEAIHIGDETNTTYVDGNFSADVILPSETGGDIHIGDATNTTYIEGNLFVNGTTTSVSSNDIALDSRYIYLNSTDSTNFPKSTGLITTNYPGSTGYTLSNFVAHSGTTPAQCSITPDTGLSSGDFLQIWSADSGYVGTNKGIYEVLSCAAGILTVKGYGTLVVADYTKEDFETDAVSSLSGVRIVLNGLQFNESGFPKFLVGNNTNTMTSEFLAYHNSNVEFMNTDTQAIGVDTINALTGSVITVNDSVDINATLKANVIASHSGGQLEVSNTMNLASGTGVITPTLFVDIINDRSLGGISVLADIAMTNANVSGTLKTNTILPLSGTVITMGSGVSDSIEMPGYLEVMGDIWAANSIYTNTINNYSGTTVSINGADLDVLSGDIIARQNVKTDHLVEYSVGTGIKVDSTLIPKALVYCEGTLVAVSQFHMNDKVYFNDVIGNEKTASIDGIRDIVYQESDSTLKIRPYSKYKCKVIDENFLYSKAIWETTPTETIDVPILGDILNPIILAFQESPSTVGSIISDGVWRIKGNNLNNVYSTSLNVGGLLLGIPPTVGARCYAVSKPLAAMKSVSRGFSYESQFTIQNLAGSVYFAGMVSNVLTFALDGSIDLGISSESSLYMSFDGSNQIVFCVNDAGTLTAHNTGVFASNTYKITFRIEWDHDNSNVNFSVFTNGDSATYSFTQGNKDAQYNPMISVFNPSSNLNLLTLQKIYCISY